MFNEFKLNCLGGGAHILRLGPTPGQGRNSWWFSSECLRPKRLFAGPTAFFRPLRSAGKALSIVDGFTAEAAAAPQAVLIAGLNGTGRPLKQNVARVYSGGQPRASLLKRHLVPGWEAGYAAGTGPLIWPEAGTRLGLAICKDFDFTDTSRALGRADARVVLAPAWDFAGTEAIHAQMARFRAAEGGFAPAR